MGCPKRVIVGLLTFLGFLIFFGFRTVFTMVMVYVIKENDNTGVSLFDKCTLNGTSNDLQLNWSVSLSQYLSTAYFLGYLITQLPGGYLAVRFSPTKVFGGAILISSSCFLIMAFFLKYSPIVAYVARIIQGLAEGTCQPAMGAVMSSWAPKSERARMVGLSYSGIYLSASLGSAIAGSTTCYVSWNAALFIYGGMGILWSFVWFCMVYDSPLMHPSLSEKERDIFEKEGSNILKSSSDLAKSVPWRRLLTSLPVWALYLANFTRSWVFAMIIFEIPQYFTDAFALNVSTIGFLTCFPPILMTVAVVFGGIFVDKLVKTEKVSVTVGRKLSLCIGFGSESLCILALGFARDYSTAAVLIVVAEGLAGLSIASFKVNPVDLAPQYASVLTGIVRSGVLGAAIGTAIAGALREKNAESWYRIFFITGSVHLFAVIFYSVFGSGQQQGWAQTEYTMLDIPKGDSVYGSTVISLEKTKDNLAGIEKSNTEENHNGIIPNEDIPDKK